MQQQQQQHQLAPATDWTSFHRSSSYNQHQHLQQSVPYLDYCNAVVPARSWRQLSASQSSGSVNQLTTSCRSAVSSSLSTESWTDNMSSTCCKNSVGEHHFECTADSATSWYMNAHRLVSASSTSYLANTRPPVIESYSQHQTHLICGSAQRTQVDKLQLNQSSSQLHSGTELVDRVLTNPCSDARQRHPRSSKEPLVPLIIHAILSAADMRLSLADICRYIKQQSVSYAKSTDEVRWHNNVRHTLSHYEFFVKSGRVPTGRGNYWTVHPVCRAAFAANDMRIKRARHAVQLYEKRANVTRQTTLQRRTDTLH